MTFSTNTQLHKKTKVKAERCVDRLCFENGYKLYQLELLTSNIYLQNKCLLPTRLLWIIAAIHMEWIDVQNSAIKW